MTPIFIRDNGRDLRSARARFVDLGRPPAPVIPVRRLICLRVAATAGYYLATAG
jgi:hypothetical protein